uniref:Phytoene desaturase n=1 Tax=Acidianus brierleyi TaxID=41673 RepID=A0A2U9II87_9CREN
MTWLTLLLIELRELKLSLSIVNWKIYYFLQKAHFYCIILMKYIERTHKAMRSKKVKNLYYVGHYTHPGVGVPMVLISAEILANIITINQ